MSKGVTFKYIPNLMPGKAELIVYFLFGLGTLLIMIGLILFVIGVGRNQKSKINILGIALETTNAALIIFIVGVAFVFYGFRKYPEPRSVTDSEYFCNQLKKVLKHAETDFRKIRKTSSDSTKGLYHSKIGFWSNSIVRISEKNNEFEVLFYEGKSSSNSRVRYTRFQDRILSCVPNIQRASYTKRRDSLNYVQYTRYYGNDYQMKLERNVYNNNYYTVTLRITKAKS